MLDREFFLGFIKIHILYHAVEEPIFGVGMAAIATIGMMVFIRE